jgi:hypothetical protein
MSGGHIPGEGRDPAFWLKFKSFEELRDEIREQSYICDRPDSCLFRVHGGHSPGGFNPCGCYEDKEAFDKLIHHLKNFCPKDGKVFTLQELEE